MNLADLLPSLRQLSTPQKLALIQELISDIDPATPQANAADWDLSPSEIERRNATMLALLDKWEAEGDEQEQTATWEFLQQALDEDRLSSNRSFFPQ